ncbi:MAG TPA: glycosyltransferase, partial [Thermoguttaceae bacterium]|nr:glycosyltransferase [Thermoguttaceae bacterium]
VDLQDNLHALLQQDYGDYEVTFIVESTDDQACPMIRRVMADHPSVATRLVVAGKATSTGQKIHNLRAATAQLAPEVRYLAFIDSDSRARPDWLRIIVTRLSRHTLGAVTGYRWFVPKRSTFVNYLLYSINSNVMALLGRSSHHLIWGGSWGIRRDVFESIGLHAAWNGALTEDLVAGRQLRRAGLRVRFEPACIVASPVDYSPQEMCSFLRRQYLLGRLYTFDWWLFALASTTLSNLGWLANSVALALSLIYGVLPVWVPLSMYAMLYLPSVYRGAVRQSLIRTYFPDQQQSLRWARRFDVVAGPIVGLINWLGVLGSLFGQRVTWRGISYLVSPTGKVRAVEHRNTAKAHPTTIGASAMQSKPTAVPAEITLREPVLVHATATEDTEPSAEEHDSFRKAG